MYLRKPKIKYGLQQWDTYCDINGVEQEVMVHYETSPAEPDVNFAGDLEVVGVYFEDQGDMMGDMTDKELDDLTERCNEHENDRTNPDNDPRY